MPLFLPFLLATFLISLLSTPLDAKVTFLTNTYPPFSDCTQYTQDSISSSIFGAEVELLRDSFSFLNWTEGIDYEFECVGSTMSNLFDRFNTDNETQLGVFGGAAISSTRLQNGLIFSQPTTSSSLPLVYKLTSKGWFFRRSLDLVSWGILVATVVLMGGLLYFLENREAAYINMLYNAFCQFFLTPDYPISYFPSKIANFFSTFLVAIIVIIFTAVSTNIFDSDRNFGSQLSLGNLDHEKVYSNAMLEDYLTQYGIPLTTLHYSNYFDLLNKIDELDINYLVIDGPYADFLVRQRCDLYIATNEIDLIHYGVMFHNTFQRDLLNQISGSILNAKQAKSFDDYISEYYLQKTGLNFCQGKKESDSEKVSLYDTRGLWYILLVGMGIGVGFLIVDRLGLFVKKSLQIYGLQGVRSKRDGKVQRRVATILAIHAGVSLQSASFLKRLSQQALEKQLIMTKMSLSPLMLLKAHQKLQRQPEEGFIEIKDFSIIKENKTSFVGWLKRVGSERNGLRRNVKTPTHFRALNNGKGMNFTEYIEKSQSLKRETSNSNEASSQRESIDSRDKGASPMRGSTIRSIEKPIKRSETKRSSFLNQSAVKYQLDKKLHLKLGTLVERDLALNFRDVVSNENNSQASGGSPTVKDVVEPVAPNKKWSFVTKSFGFVERMFGKKGLKRNKQINTVANVLLAQKEAMLSQELEKKKAEVISRSNALSSPPSLLVLKKSISSQMTSPRANSPRGSSPRPRNDTLNPSIFKLKHMNHQSSRWGSTGDSQQNPNLSSRRLGDDLIKDSPIPSCSTIRRFNFQDYLHASESPRLIPYSLTPRSLAMIGRDQREEFDFGTQDENTQDLVINSFSAELEMYNFSHIINISPTNRQLIKKDNI